MLRNLLALTALVLTLSACTTPIQMAYDAEVDRLCAVDGGAHVFEVVTLPKNRFDKQGVLNIDPESKQTELDFYVTYSEKILNEQSPAYAYDAYLTRRELSVIRSSDKKILGVLVSYSRYGGDMPIAPPEGSTSHQCPPIDQFSRKNILKLVLKPN